MRVKHDGTLSSFLRQGAVKTTKVFVKILWVVVLKQKEFCQITENQVYFRCADG